MFCCTAGSNKVPLSIRPIRSYEIHLKLLLLFLQHFVKLSCYLKIYLQWIKRPPRMRHVPGSNTASGGAPNNLLLVHADSSSLTLSIESIKKQH